jgi:hypothetical protein
MRTNARYGTVPMESEVQHPMTTTSLQYRRLIGECRERWNRFDPIGIRGMGAVHLNEYDSYLAHTAELLLADADSFKIAAYVRQVVRANMGISNFPEERIVEFAQELEAAHSLACGGSYWPRSCEKARRTARMMFSRSSENLSRLAVWPLKKAPNE